MRIRSFELRIRSPLLHPTEPSVPAVWWSHLLRAMDPARYRSGRLACPSNVRRGSTGEVVNLVLGRGTGSRSIVAARSGSRSPRSWLLASMTVGAGSACRGG